jgi:outer membrane protein OmpA-like peptidoglycan-associated protein
LIGAGVGAATGGAIGLYKNSQKALVAQLQKHDIQYVEYGDRMSVIVPVDKYFLFNSSKFNESQYVGLNTLIKLLQSYPNSVIYVAAFTDNVGPIAPKIRLSQAQAETMLTFIWANGFKAQQLQAQGYGDYFPISDNSSVHGSAQNRRLEIHWFKKGSGCKVSPLRTMYATK